MNANTFCKTETDFQSARILDVLEIGNFETNYLTV